MPIVDAIDAILNGMSRSEKQSREVRKSVEKAYSQDAKTEDEKEVLPSFNLDLLCRYADRIKETIDAERLAEHSPLDVRWIDPAGFLDAVFQPSETAWITNNIRSRDGFLYAHGSELDAELLCDFPARTVMEHGFEPIRSELRSTAHTPQKQACPISGMS
jgi:hypothetical protein